MQLSRFPRVHLCHQPTPLEPMKRFMEWLGGPQILIKRDDCTGLATGGNKTRKLEFLIGDALHQDADTVITQGAAQSNHVRQTAAAAALFGLDCHAVLERRVKVEDEMYERTGNVLLDRIFGCHLQFVPNATDMDAAMEDIARDLGKKGRKPYIIPGGGSNPVGALGYVSCALELTGQLNALGLHADYVVHATGSAGTQAGLVAGFHGVNSDLKVLGVSVRRPKLPQEKAVLALAQETSTHIGLNTPITADEVKVNPDYVGGGYGVPMDSMVEAVTMTAQLEGILLDPVYSGKGMAGLIGLIREGRFRPEETIVFLHTGGSQSLYAYEKQWN